MEGHLSRPRATQASKKQEGTDMGASLEMQERSTRRSPYAWTGLSSELKADLFGRHHCHSANSSPTITTFSNAPYPSQQRCNTNHESAVGGSQHPSSSEFDSISMKTPPSHYMIQEDNLLSGYPSNTAQTMYPGVAHFSQQPPYSSPLSMLAPSPYPYPTQTYALVPVYFMPPALPPGLEPPPGLAPPAIPLMPTMPMPMPSHSPQMSSVREANIPSRMNEGKNH